MNNNCSIPIYQKIALDIANRIKCGDILEGKKIYGRSTLAGEYSVSPETIRRSIKLLEDVNVVQSTKGSGITVISKQNALLFISKFQNVESIASFKTYLNSLMIKKKSLEEDILSTMNKIIDYSGRLKNIDPITPLEIEIPSNCKLLDKTISDVNFWQNTGATIVGIRRNGVLIISPGPNAVFKNGDIVLVVGEETISNSIKIFLST